VEKGEKEGKTLTINRQSGSANVDLKPGIYLVEISGEGFAPIKRETAVEKGATTFATVSIAAKGAGGAATLVAGGAALKWGRIELKENLTFVDNGIAVSPQQAPLIDSIAQLIKANPSILELMIEGHTDNQGKEEELGQKSNDRAEWMRKALIERGVDERMLKAQGMGGSMPRASNRTSFGREQNNRLEFYVTKTATGE
jgi:outer membrane protein OmpA-like peptidoglycan-associated protein